MTCQTCRRPMRRRRANPADHPGTVPAMNQTICHTCARHKRENPEPIEDFRVEQARAALDYWLAHRRNRVRVKA